jgi:hypothetical protein
MSRPSTYNHGRGDEYAKRIAEQWRGNAPPGLRRVKGRNGLFTNSVLQSIGEKIRQERGPK